MRAAAIGQYGNLDFVFLDLKQHSSSLDKEIFKELKKLEKLVVNILASRKKIDSELDLSLSQLFSLRIKGLEWLSSEKKSLHSVLDEVSPSITNLGTNPRLKKIGFHISQALNSNKKLVNFFSNAGVLTKENLQSVSGFNYSSFVVALQFMPPQVRKLLFGITNASLQIEFISVAAIMLNTNEAKCSDVKINQLTALASKANIDYMGYASQLLTMAKNETFLSEKREWNSLGFNTLENTYAESEPDYENTVLKEPNPDYQK